MLTVSYSSKHCKWLAVIITNLHGHAAADLTTVEAVVAAGQRRSRVAGLLGGDHGGGWRAVAAVRQVTLLRELVRCCVLWQADKSFVRPAKSPSTAFEWFRGSHSNNGKVGRKLKQTRDIVRPSQKKWKRADNQLEPTVRSCQSHLFEQIFRQS